MQRFSALTLNIWHREAPWEARREIIRRGLQQLSPDIIGLQEVLELELSGQRRSQARELTEGTPYDYVYGCAQTLGPGLEFGNALLSKHPIVAHQVLRLPGEETGETRSVVHARVALPFGEVPVFVTHLNWKLHHGSVRLRQIKRLMEIVAELAPPGKTFPPVLMGDFNAEPESDEIRFLRGFATLDGQSVFFADAWAYGGDGGPGFTFDRRNPYAARSHEPPRRIDYIFVAGPDPNRHFIGEPLATKLVFDAPEGDVWASDHFGLYTEISASK
jgi:endonuclease/exonuclease/phosphatase family metal-dependent hydrolase